ncbi:MAG: nickel pincer cofactor biosynthesis protein LarB, partial [Methanobacteriota archaeon]
MPLKRILENYKKGKISLEDAEKEVRLFSMAKISNWSNLDICRENRTGVPEVVFGEGKTDEELVRLVNEFVKRKGRCIITRLSSSRIAALKKKIKKMSFAKSEKAGVVVVKSRGYKLNPTGGRVAILCAGTSDVARAEEARIISEEMGCSVFTFYDVGVAGIHRLIPAIKKIIKEDVDVVIAAAGMEGALPSVVAGLVDVPVIGLPISTGYGAGGRGETALFAMLQSCSPGLSVVNIDNGFGAGVVASLIASRAAKFRCSPA